MEHLLEFDQKEFATTEEGDALLKVHGSLKEEMSEAYIGVSEEGKNLLSALQKPLGGDDRSAKARSRVSDYTEAVSHVMDVILEMHEQNRQLTILWEKQRVRLSQKYKLCEYERESSEVGGLFAVTVCKISSRGTQRCLGVKWFVRRRCLSNLASLCS